MKNGFTLIELLVVIAIIGILASVVLASLNTARSRGSDTAVKAAMSNLRTQSVLFYDNGQTFGGSLTNNCNIGILNSSAGPNNAGKIMANITNNANGTPTCYVGVNVFAVSAPLRGGGVWCVDAGGKTTTTTAQTDGTCL